MNIESDKVEINFFDRLFSFRKKTILKYIKNILWNRAASIDYKDDIVKKHWLFLFLHTWYFLIWITLFLFILFLFSSFVFDFTNFIEWKSDKMWFLWINVNNENINKLLWGMLPLSIFIFWSLLFFVIKNWFSKKTFPVVLILLLFLLLFVFKENVFNDFWIFMERAAFFWIYLIFFLFFYAFLFFFKNLYNIYIDYKNDFIVMFTGWIYYSNKHWVLWHDHINVDFNKITNIELSHKWFLSSFFWFWSITIHTVSWMDNIDFEYANRSAFMLNRINNLRLNLVSWKKKWKKIFEEVKSKPFLSKIRDKILFTMKK